jgi:hypothetical protein
VANLCEVTKRGLLHLRKTERPLKPASPAKRKSIPFGFRLLLE